MDVAEFFREFETTTLPDCMADIPWWQVFEDPALQDLIREALRNNYDLKSAAARVDEARAFIGVERATLLPHADLTASAQRDRNSQVLYPWLERMTSTYTGGFNTSWEIDLWGRLRQKVTSAKMQALAMEEYRRGIILTLVADVAQYYFQLRALDLELDIAQETLKTRKGTYDLFLQRQRGGAASNLDVAQAEGDMYETEATIPDLKRSIAIQENKICLLLARDPGPIKRGAAITDQKNLPVIPAAGLPSGLLKRRPDVIQAEYDVKSANALVGASIGEFFPSLNLTNFIGSEGRRPSDLWGDKSYVWNIGGETKLPLFKGGENVYKYKVAKAQWRQTVEQYKRTVISAFTDVANALTDIQRYAEIRAAQEKQVTADREAAKLSKIRYEGGFSSYLEVLDAERRRFNSETSLAETIGDQYVSLANLYRALGGGWQLEEKTA
jgi:multidrug efflux system outer membrane protein